MTQNYNESFNAMIWSRIPKSTYALFSQLQLDVYDAVANFNNGRKARIFIFEKLNMIPGKYCSGGCRKINEKRLSAFHLWNQQRSAGKLGEAKQNLRMIKIMTKKDNLMKKVHSKT